MCDMRSLITPFIHMYMMMIYEEENVIMMINDI